MVYLRGMHTHRVLKAILGEWQSHYSSFLSENLIELGGDLLEEINLNRIKTVTNS